MPFYEFLCLAKPTLAKPQLARMMQKVGELVMGEGGIVTKVTSYGEQHLAYDIRKPFEKYEKAHIWQLNFVSTPETLAKLDRDLKLNQDALRWLVTKRKAAFPEVNPKASSKSEAVSEASQASL